MGVRRKMGLSKNDIADLEVKIPRRDTIAQSQSLPTTTGRIEAIEGARVPWLRERRRLCRRDES